MAALRVQALGPLLLRRGAQDVSPRGRRARAVLAVLVARTGTPVPVDSLIEEIWGEDPPPAARNSLQSHISRIRSVLGTDRIVRRDESYELHLADHELDALQFRVICRGAREHANDARWHEAIAAYDDALTLWRGEAFVGFDDLPSCRGWANELGEQRLLAVEERIDALLGLGRHADAVAELGPITAANPWRERLWRQRALSLYRSDRQAESLRVLSEFRTRLIEETGIDPSGAFDALERDLLEGADAVQAPPGPASATTSITGARPGALPLDLGRLERSVLVGRERELDSIDTACRQAMDGGTSCVILGGEAGAGKTRLAAAVAAQILSGGGDVRYGRCAERLDLAYEPFASALRDVDVELVAQLERSGASLSLLFPELATREAEPRFGVPRGVGSGRFVLYEAVADLLAGLARPRGLLLVLDDLHWASSEALGLLEHILSVARPPRVAVLGTYRDTDISTSSELSRLVQDLLRRGDVTHLRLGGLDTDGIGEVLRSYGLAVTDQVARTVWRTTAGNPLLVTELAREAGATGVRDLTADTAGFDGMGVPEQVRSIIRRRLTDLGPAAEVLEWAALLGVEFELRVLEAALEAEGIELRVLDALEATDAAGIVREMTAGWWQFCHGLTRDALLVESTRSRRARRHQVLADAIDAVYGSGAESQLGRVAHHCCEAAEPGHTEQAVERSLAAAKLRLRQLATEEALVHIAEGLVALSRDLDPDQASLADLQIAAAEAHLQRFSEEGRVEAAEQAAAAARRAGSPDRLGRAAVVRSAFWTQGGLDTGALALVEEALGSLSDHESDLRAELLAHLAGMLAVSGLVGDELAGRRPIALAEQAVALARPGTPVSAVARSALIVALWDGPHAARQVALADQIEAENRPESSVLAARWRAAPRLVLGDRAGCERDVTLLVEQGRRLGWRQLEAYGQQCQAMLALMDARFDEAATVGAQAVETADGHANFARVFQSQLFWMAVERDQLRSMLPFLRTAVEENPRLPVFPAMLAVSLAHLGELGEAEGLLDSYWLDAFAAVPRDVLWLATIGGSATVTALLGSRRHAEAILPLLDPYRGQLLVIAGGAFVYGAVDRFRAMMAAVLGDRGLAESAFASAIHLEAAVGSPALEAGTRWWRAHLLGDPDGDDAAIIARLAAEHDLPALRRRLW